MSDADISLRLTATFATQGGSIASWTLVDNRDQTEGYDAQGRLVTISYKDGQTLAFDYTTDGLLNRVRDTQGRSLWFTYEQATNSTALTRRARITSISTPDGKTIRYAYNSNGMLSQVIYPDTTPTVDTDNPRRQYHYGEGTNATQTMLTGITDESGQRYASWRYDAQGRAWLSVHGNDTDYKDRVEQIYNSNGTTTVRTFQSATTFVDNVQSFVTTQGVVKLAASTQPCPTCGGTNTQTTTYDANGNRDIATDFRGITTDYDIDVRGLETRRVEVANTTCPASLPNCLSNRRTIETDWHPQFREVLETRTRNATGTLVALVRFAYNTRGQRIANCQVDPTNSAALAYTCGSLTNAPVGVRQTRYTYCEAADAALPGSDCPIIGKPRTIDGPRTDVVDVTSFSYYAADSTNCSLAGGCDYLKGDLRLVTNALGHVQSFLRYDGAGRVRRIRDANGIITDLSYTPVGLLETRTTRFNADGAPSPMDATTRMEYEPYGALRKTIDADGVSVTFERDSAHRLVGVADSLGNRIRFTLDGAGNRVREETLDSNGQLTRLLARLFDVNSRLRALIRAPYAAQTNLDDPTALKTTFTYDANGNSDLITDPLGHIVDQDFDEFSRRVRLASDVGGGGINSVIQTDYDANNRIRRVTDPKQLLTDYGYDSLGNRSGLSSPDTGVQVFNSDSAGNRTGITDARSIVSNRSYDALNRLTSITFPTPGEDIQFAWDQASTKCPTQERYGIGRLSGFIDESGSTDFCYDLHGNVVRKIQTMASGDLTVQYQFSLGKRIVGITYPSGLRISFSRDASGRISSVQYIPSGGSEDKLVTSVKHLPFGPLAYLQWSSGSSLSRTYDLNYSIKRIESTSSQGLNAYYGFDDVGNLTSISSSDGTSTYAYDALGRLISDTSSESTRTYTHDATGNRTSANGVNYGYSVDSHRLNTVGVAQRTYDAAGNLLSPNRYDRSGDTFRYNQRNRLSARQVNGRDRNLYQYNARGERVRTQDLIGASERFFAYDESGHLLGEYLADRKVIWEYVWVGDTPVAVVRGDEWSAVEADHVDTPRRLIDGKQGVVNWSWSVRADAFGATAPNEDPDGDGTRVEFNLRFPGQYYDRATGLNYNYFRDYDPVVGRYIESDPIGLDGGISTYLYVGGNPLNASDFYGLRTRCLPGFQHVTPGNAGSSCAPIPPPPPPPPAPGCSGSCSQDWAGCVSACVRSYTIAPTLYAGVAAYGTTLVTTGTVAACATGVGETIVIYETATVGACSIECGVNPCLYPGSCGGL